MEQTNERKKYLPEKQAERLRRLILIWITALLTGIASGNLFGLLKADVIRIALLAAMLLFAGMLITAAAS